MAAKKAIAPALSDYAAKVRAVIRRIPRGKTASYGQVAEAAGYPRAVRGVVRVLNTSAGLPWHRIVGAGGRISLKGASGLEQRMLLESEGVLFLGSRIDPAFALKAVPKVRRS